MIRSDDSTGAPGNVLTRGLTAVAVAAVCLPVATGCDRPQSNERAAPPRETTDFALLFGHHCSGCHGAEGKWGPAPPLNDSLFLAIVPESLLKDVIRGGRPGTLMPAFGGDGWNSLSQHQIEVLASQIRARWGGDATAPQGAPDYRSPHSSAGDGGDPAAGGKLFAEICASCHGDDGRGGDMVGPIHSSAFLALISDQALRRIVITGRPDLGMPNYVKLGTLRASGQPLTSGEVAHIVALLASWRQTDDYGQQETVQNEGGSPK